MGLFQSEAKKQYNAYEEGECLAEKAAGGGGKSDEGASEVNMESNLDAEVDGETKGGSF